jgi:hypothetical protein
MPYRYLPQFLSGIDPRAQTEDVGDDPVRASTLAVANLRRVVPKLVAWTTKPGGDYEDLDELYGETLGIWRLYMGHVASVIGGVQVDAKTAEQDGAVYSVVPRTRQQAALRFLGEQAFRTPTWLAPAAVLSRIGPPAGQTSLVNQQGGVVSQLLDPRRLGRLAAAEALDPANAYPVAAFLGELRRALWGVGPRDAGLGLDENRRVLQRVYLERLETIITPPREAAAPGGPGGGTGGPPPSPLLVAPNVPRSDLPALARSELRAVRDLARQAAPTAPAGVARAHWEDVVARIDRMLEPRTSP